METRNREMDTFINLRIKGTVDLAPDTINADLELAIISIPSVAKKLSAFRRLDYITARREPFADYSNIHGTVGECGTLITTAFTGPLQPGENDRDRLNSMIPGIVQSTLLATGHYEDVNVTL